MLKKYKPEEVKRVEKLLNAYSVIGIINMHGLPAKQLQKIRDGVRGRAVITMAKKTILQKAFDNVDKKYIKELEKKIIHEPALLLTNENPFKIFKLLKEKRIPASAKAGNIAPADIIIPAGPTPIPPGPAISIFQKAGLKTKVEQGKISVLKEKCVVKAGETINEEIVGILGLLKIEPMEIGIEVVAVWEDGIVYEKAVLDVDAEDYLNMLRLSVSQMVSLSLNTGYIVKETAELAIQKAFLEAKILALNANIIDKSFMDDLLRKAVIEAKELEKLIKNKGG